MRIDREGFLLAVAALAGCEHAASTTAVEPVANVAPKPASNHDWYAGLTMQDRTNVTAACAHRAEAACQESLREIMPQPRGAANRPVQREVVSAVDPDDAKVARLGSEQVAQYCQETFTPPTCETPLVVAFDGQPIEFAPAGHDRFAFVPGEPATTDWPTAATPWIALDLDGDGAITSGAELFGSSTVLASGGRASNGFAALAELDANGDGILDARDPMFDRLVLWSDRNGDHRSTPDEQQPLARTVTSISLAFSLDARCTQRDDCEGERGTLHWRDSAGADHAGAVVDVYLHARER